MRYQPDGGPEWDIKDGVLFLQRVDDKYAAKFFFDKAGVFHYKNDIDFEGETNVHATGELLSCIALEKTVIAPGCALPDIPELEFVENSEFEEDTSFTVSGYPAETLNEACELTATKNKMYSISGECKSKTGPVVACNLLTSKG